LLRRHPITFLPILFLFFVLLAVPVVVYFLINSIYPTLFSGAILFPIATLFASTYYLGIFLYFYTQFIDYYLDVWVVTNDRIVDIEQFGLFARTISELDLFRIQDVTTDIRGFFATIFHYGNVSIKTASHNINIVFRHVAHPNKIREDLIKLSHEDRKYHYSQPSTKI
jgi:uncharacterized membrane protein YdbT with pleckstrin-like domain